jgi:hypothetical protein
MVSSERSNPSELLGRNFDRRLRGRRVVMQYFALKRDRLFDALLNFLLRLV